jgi:endonuclease VIII
VLRIDLFVIPSRISYMPEGPEIKRAADAIAQVLEGKTIESAALKHPSLQGMEKYIEGHTVTGVETRGKALLTHFSSNRTMYSHNQLYGVWKVTANGEAPRTNRALRVGLHTNDHSALLYSATDISLWDTSNVNEHPFLARLGPDLLADGLTAEDLTARLVNPEFENRRLASLYLDQKFIAGVGNYLRSEILFFAGVNPLVKPKALHLKAKKRLARNTLTIGQRSYRTGGITLPKKLVPKNPKQGGRYYERDRFAVFARAGKPCRTCRTPVEKAVLASRRIYWCPTCQAE